MNYIKHLTGFFDLVIQDRNLNPTHISLYIAMFQAWNVNRFKNPISITRDEMMRISKICSKATYHKCMRELNERNYIKYEPSFNPYKGSLVTLHNFSQITAPVQKKANNLEKNLPTNEQVLNRQKTASKTSNETGTEQALVPSINYINNKNISKSENIENLDEQAKNFEDENNIQLKNQNSEMQSAFADTNKKQTQDGQQKEKSSAKKEKEEMLETLDDANRQMLQTFANSNENQIKNSWQKSSAKKEEKETCQTELVEVSHNQKSNPVLEEVKTYFHQNNFPEIEAQKFFNYFSSIGWLVGGKTPMVDWQSAAQNWMLNSTNFIQNKDISAPNRAQQLNSTTDKNYAEPL
jgi:hypothetical protein